MSGLRRIIGNTVISLLGQVVTWASTLLLTIAYGRFLGDIKFGELYFATTFVSLIGFPVEFGFNQQLTRDVAEDSEQALAYLWNALLIKTVLWAALFGVILLLAWGIGYSPEQRELVTICGIDLWFGSLVNTFAALHYAFERTLFPSIGTIFEKGLSAVIGFILLKNGASVQVMAFVLLGGSVVNAFWVALWFYRLIGWRVVLDRKTIKKLVHNSIPFVVYGVLGVIYYRIDTVLLSVLTNTSVVGWYGAGYRLFDTLLFIPNLLLNAVMYPVFSKLSGTSQAALKTAIEKCMNLLLICSLPIAALLIVAAPNIIGFLYHRADFANDVPVIQALAPGLIFLYINTLFGNVIVSTKGEKKIPISAAVALVFNLGLNIWLIPLYQQNGAAIVTSLTELLLLCLSILFLPKGLLPGKSLKVGIKALVATLIMSLAVMFLRTLSILVILPIVLPIYAGAIILLGTIPREDVQSLYQAMKDKRKQTLYPPLSNAVDESIYTQITERLPAVKLEKSLVEESPQSQIEEGEDVTERLPVVKLSASVTEKESEPEIEDEDATERLPVVRLSRLPYNQEVQLEG